MFKTTLYFPSFDVLNQFRRKLSARKISLFPKINVLAAELEEGEINLACNRYHASVIRKQRTETIVAMQPVGMKEAV